ncbi:MAG: Ppx/GppA family phosphatase [Oligoflexia bacterium]|nr:Ppx/GppA family phosphatase [Oligoflexia bacterium]
MNAAAIDLGTNSIKILIVKREVDGRIGILFRHRAVVRLGEGTFKDPKGKIPRHVQLRALKVLQTYAKLLDAYKVDVVRATGTSALRDAKNGPEFVREVRGKTGIALEVLPGEEEARLIVKGVASDLKIPNNPVLFVDIGGGSCEVTLVTGKKIKRFASLPLGAVRLTEKFIAGARASQPELRKLDSHVKRILKDSWPSPKKTTQAFGSAGTIRALARIIGRTELTEAEDLIKGPQLAQVVGQISKMSRKQIAGLPGVDSKRSEILLAGSRVLLHVFNHFGVKNLKVSQRGLREGLLLDLLSQPSKAPTIDVDSTEAEHVQFLDAVARRYNSDRGHCHQVWRLARQLFEELEPVHGLSPKLRPLLRAACLLHDVGRFIGETGKHKHTQYIIENSEIPFLTEKQRKFVAVLARYHRKSPPRAEHLGFNSLDDGEKRNLVGLAALLRLADALDSERNQSVRWLRAQWGPGKVIINISSRPGTELDQLVIADKAKLFEDTYKVVVAVTSLKEKAELKFESRKRDL